MKARQRKDFPNLLRMALNILLILVMAADPKRFFFSTRLTVTNRQNNLLIKTIKALKCIKS